MQSSFDATGIKCDLRKVEDNIIAQPVHSYDIQVSSSGPGKLPHAPEAILIEW